MWEQSKAAKRRFYDGLFHTRYFVGKGIDIGGKPDPLDQYAGVFARMESARTWDLGDGDAQFMRGVDDDAFDFVHSSHCLEHMHDPRQALLQWIRIAKPGGFLVILVPDEDLYEQGHWPSKFNADHKWTFTVQKPQSWSPRSLNVTDLVAEVSHLVEVERISVIRDFFREKLVGRIDQTITPVSECAIEIILRKRAVALSPRNVKVSTQVLFESLPQLRGVAITAPAKDIPHSVVIPLATYAPWMGNNAFMRAYEAGSKHTLVDVYRCWELWQLVQQVVRVPGDILEVGVWRGGTASVLGSAMKTFGMNAKLYLADTFSGVVKASECDTAYKGGEHGDTSPTIVEELLQSMRVTNYELLSGVFPDETAGCLDQSQFRLCHIDVDVYRSAKEVFEWVWPRLSPGGVVVFDDYGFLNCEGVTRVVNELAARDDAMFVHNLNGHALLVKLPGTATLRKIAPQGIALREGGFNALNRCRHGWMVYNLNDTHIGSILDLYGEFSPGEVEMFKKLLRLGDVVVESGANIGTHTVPLSQMVGSEGRIFAIEPQRIQYQTLCANIALNSITNTVCLNEANADSVGEMRIPQYDPYIKQSSGSQCLESEQTGELVRLSTIDSLGLERCQLIKIDVEGMEERVLKGAVETINRCKPILYVENDREERSASLVKFISDLGYRIWWHKPAVVEENNYFGVPRTLFKNTISLNVVCLPKAASEDMLRSMQQLAELQ